jgi:SsrA-binding protein
MPPPQITNSKARRDYHILESFEAGIALRGTEVKSLRQGRANINDAFARIENGEVFLWNAHIDEFAQANRFNHEPKRSRKLLLKKSEIHRLFGKVAVKGHALVPLRIYFQKGFAKVELALAKGKAEYDKREDIKRKTAQREMERAISNAQRRK